MAQKIYRSAVVGLGVMGQVADGLGGEHPILYKPCCHSDAYEVHSRTELVAGSTRNLERQEQFKSKRGKPVYADYREMLEAEKPDLVSVTTPATVHSEVVLAATEAGVKGIWCEKAMGKSLNECDKMIEACGRTGTTLIINHQRRWNDRYFALKQAVDNGEIGDLQSIHINAGGGRLSRQGSHLFDLARWFSSEEMEWGIGWLDDPEGFDPGGTGIFKTRNGVRIFIDLTIGMRHGCWIELVGDKGILKIIDDGFHVQLWTPDDRPAMQAFNLMGSHHLPLNYSVQNPFLNALDDMLQCIEIGGKPKSTGRDGRAAFEMITAIHLSNQRKKAVVEFPLLDRDLVILSN